MVDMPEFKDAEEMEAWQRRQRRILVPMGEGGEQARKPCPLPDTWETHFPSKCPTCGMGVGKSGMDYGINGLPSIKKLCPDCGEEQEWGEDGWLIRPGTPLDAWNDHAHHIRAIFVKGWRGRLRRLFRMETWWGVYTEEYARRRGLDPSKYKIFVDDAKRYG